ncbi:MAG: hypothetical protein R2854_10215 [Caldilineaceae bacterium]
MLLETAAFVWLLDRLITVRWRWLATAALLLGVAVSMWPAPAPHLAAQVEGYVSACWRTWRPTGKRTTLILSPQPPACVGSWGMRRLRHPARLRRICDPKGVLVGSLVRRAAVEHDRAVGAQPSTPRVRLVHHRQLPPGTLRRRLCAHARRAVRRGLQQKRGVLALHPRTSPNRPSR